MGWSNNCMLVRQSRQTLEGIKGNELWVDMLPGYDKQHTTDTQASQQNIHPDIRWEWVEEGEDPRVGAVGLAVQNTYPKCHKGLREVNDFLPDVGDGQRSNSKVSFLQWDDREEVPLF